MLDKPKELFNCKECGSKLDAYFDHPYNDRIIIYPCEKCAKDKEKLEEIIDDFESFIDTASDILYDLQKLKGE